MDWIKFTDKLPEDNQIILQWDRQEAYNRNDDKLIMEKMSMAPYINRFSLAEWNEENDNGKQPDLSSGDIDMYAFMELWIPVPELPVEYKEIT